MDIESAWTILVTVAAPIAAIVAFYIQLKNVKKTHLQNKKLELEVQKLKDANKKLESQIQLPTDEEIKKYSKKEPDIMFSRSTGAYTKQSILNRFVNIDWGSLITAVFAISFIVYLFYDIYRIGLWLINKF